MTLARRLRNACTHAAHLSLKAGITTRFTQAISSALRSQTHDGWISIHCGDDGLDQAEDLRAWIPDPHGRGTARGGIAVRSGTSHRREPVIGRSAGPSRACEPNQRPRSQRYRRCRQGSGLDERRGTGRFAPAQLGIEAKPRCRRGWIAAHAGRGASARGRDVAGRMARPLRPGLDRAPRITARPSRLAPRPPCPMPIAFPATRRRSRRVDSARHGIPPHDPDPRPPRPDLGQHRRRLARLDEHAAD